MKKITAVIYFSLIVTLAYSQKSNPDHWKYSVDYTPEGETVLNFHLKLDKDWHVYSQHTADGGPLPMVYKFSPNICYELNGNVNEPPAHEEYDSTFEVKVKIFEGEVTFRQKVRTTGAACKIEGSIEYQICKEACIFKDTRFAFELKKDKKK